MDDDMEEDEEGGFHGNNNRSPGSQGSSGWEVDQGKIRGKEWKRNISISTFSIPTFNIPKISNSKNSFQFCFKYSYS
jgi:hypothetical protein